MEQDEKAPITNTAPAPTGDAWADLTASVATLPPGSDEMKRFAFGVATNRELPDAEFVKKMHEILGEIQLPGANLDINATSKSAEASLVQGGAATGTMLAVDASTGVGADAEAVKDAAAHFALLAAAAVREGRTLDDMVGDPRLGNQAMKDIYEAAAQQQGKTSAQIEKDAQEKAAREMAIISGAVFGTAGIEAAAEPDKQKGTLAEALGFPPAEEAKPKNPLAGLVDLAALSPELLALNSPLVSTMNVNANAPAARGDRDVGILPRTT